MLGNPPYVKLQNLMKVDPDVVAYLTAERGGDTYQSARTGNFDLYLPFIEKGLRLLAPGGRMAYIASSLWAVNQYGEGLRHLVRRGQNLDRWLDFKSHQVFEDVITYTALQFYTRESRDIVRIATASNGEMADIDWSDPELAVPYDSVPETGEWLIATGAERALIERLARDCMRLDDPALTTAIFQGLKTSADHIYQLERLGRGRYICEPKGRAPALRGRDRRCDHAAAGLGPRGETLRGAGDRHLSTVSVRTDARGAMRLIPAADMARRFPRAWAICADGSRTSSTRDNGAFDDESWYRFSRNQSLDKREYRNCSRLADSFNTSNASLSGSAGRSISEAAGRWVLPSD